MITLIIKSGLGNQLFEYAYARYLQKLYSKSDTPEKLVINTYFIDNYDFRDVSLQHFRLNENVEFLPEKKQKKDMLKFVIKTVFANGLDMISWQILKKQPLGEEKFIKRSNQGIYYTYGSQTDYKTVVSKRKNKYVFGFFQSERNFSEIADIIKDEFEIITEQTQQNLQMQQQIADSNAVCLHIRRGDYLDPKWKDLNICNYEYYNKAINVMLRKVEKPVFYVFSNSHEDLEWIKGNYRFTNEVNDNPLEFVYVDLSNPDYEELRLMKSCKHFIISNSTFSWWAAYLSKNEHKIVLAPDRWNLSIKDDTNIYLDSWIKIPTNSLGETN